MPRAAIFLGIIQLLSVWASEAALEQPLRKRLAAALSFTRHVAWVSAWLLRARRRPRAALLCDASGLLPPICRARARLQHNHARPADWHVGDQEKPRVASARIKSTAERTRTALRGARRLRCAA